MAINDYFNGEYEIFYWRTASGIEVDFIAYGPKGLLAFEVKRGARDKPADFQGLLEFKKEYPMAKLYLVNGSKRAKKEGNVQILPFEQALKTMPKGP